MNYCQHSDDDCISLNSKCWLQLQQTTIFIYFYFSENKLTFLVNPHMKSQDLFYLKNEKIKILQCRLLQILLGAL